MKTKVDPTAENEVELSVEIPAETVKEAYEKTVSQLRSRLEMPGFRKGHVPRDLVVAHFGVDVIRGETLEEAIPEWGDAALREAGLHDGAVGTTDLQAGPLDENADYAFSLKVQMTPTPVLGEYKGLQVPRREAEVSDGQIAAQLAMLQERLASLQPVEDRAVQNGDFVLMDFEGSRDGELIEGAQGQDQMLEIGRGNLIPGFEQEVEGMRRGAERSFDVTFPEDYNAEALAGQSATFKVTVKEIKAKVVPDLDDAFAADASEFETMDELRADMRSRLEGAAEAGAQREFRAAAVDQAVANATVDVPSTMIDREARHMYEELEESVGQQPGLTMDVYLDALEKSAGEVEKELRPRAEYVIKRRLVLEAIAVAEGLSVSDEDMQELIKGDAQALERDPEELLADLKKSGRQEAVRAEMLLAKTVDFVAAQAVAVTATEAPETPAPGAEAQAGDADEASAVPAEDAVGAGGADDAAETTGGD